MNPGTRGGVRVLLAAALLPACGGTETEVVTRTVEVEVPTYDAPLAFELRSPVVGEPAAPLRPTFRWTLALGAFSYRLRVAPTADFSAPVLDVPGLTETHYTPAAALEAATAYWWRVEAVNGTAVTEATGGPRGFSTVPTGAAWSTVGCDIRRGGFNSAENGTPPLSAAWNVALAGSTIELNPVAYADGTVFATARTYFGGSTYLRALNAQNGAEFWKYDFGDVFAVGQPTVAGGRVYVGQCDHTPGTFLWSFDAGTGALAWASPVSAQWERYWAPAVVGDGVYMNGGYYGGFYGFRVSDGAQLFFNSQLEQYDEWSPAYHDGRLYTFVSGKLRAHDPATGAIQSTVTLTWNWAGWSMRTFPVVGGGRIYVIAPPVLYAVDPAAGEVDWQLNGFNFSGAPAYAEGVVYAITAGVLQARDAVDGSLLWAFAGDTQLSYPPAVAAGHVYVASRSNVYAVRISDGTQAWTSAVGGWLTVAGGRLFVARINGVLSAYALTPP